MALAYQNPSWAKIQAVATDISSAKISAVLENVSQTRRVLDRIHMVELLNEKLIELLRQLDREAGKPPGQGRAQGHPLAAAEVPRKPR